MKKDKFLKELEKKLSVLNEQERKDIIDEYKSTIEEKIKNGETEEKAIEDFGNIDELTKEILKAYKIDPKYKQNDFNNFIKDGENLIKECADNLAKGTKDAVENFKNNNEEINLSLVFEILIKVFIALIILALIKLPFMLLTSIGNGILGAFFSPFDILLKVIWSLFLTVIYIIVIVLVISKIFKQYFIKKETNEEESDVKVETKSTKKNDKKEVKKEENNAIDKIVSIAMTLIKIFVVIFILIPLIGINIGFVSLTTFSLFFWIKGINLLGATLMFAGMAMISLWFIYIIKNLLENKHFNVYLLLIGIITMITGGLLFAHMITNINYIDEAPEINNSYLVEKSYEIDKKVYINSLEKNIDKEIDENLPDNTFKMIIKYDKKYYDIKIDEDNNYVFEEEDCLNRDLCGTYNYYHISYNGDTKKIKPLYNMFINNLKKNKVYNYSKIYSPEIKIYANEKTMNFIEIG